MGLYNFKAQFVPFILDGRKTHTIRAIRKHPQKVGGMMHLYTGLRQRGAKLLMRARCIDVQQITISRAGKVIIEGYPLTPDERKALAVSDGFNSFSEMMTFWDGRLPFVGQVLHWQSGGAE